MLNRDHARARVTLRAPAEPWYNEPNDHGSGPFVTVFTAGAQNTLPLWIFGAIRLGQQLPEVNAVVSIVILLTIIPVVLAARLAGAGAVTRSARNVPVN